MSRTKRTGYCSVSETVDIDVCVEDVIESATDEQLRAELRSRQMDGPGDDIIDVIRGWRDALEAGATPQSVALEIRRFMFCSLPAVDVDRGGLEKSQ